MEEENHISDVTALCQLNNVDYYSIAFYHCQTGLTFV